MAWVLPEPPPPDAKAELGRSLFFDPRLSYKSNVSCSSCHHPGLSWSDARPFAMIGDRELGRHTPSLINVAYSQTFFWDGRVQGLENAILEHLQMPGFADRDADDAPIARLSPYSERFRKLFGSPDVTKKRIAASIAAFLQTIVARNTKFDRWIMGKAVFTPEERRGYELFVGKAGCVSCHTPPTFSDGKFHNIGINSVDPGRFDVSGKLEDQHAFKTPHLRQVLYTAPYMHNGSKQTLRQVVEFYDRGGDRPAKNNPLKPLHLSEEEKADLVAFLKTLQQPPEPVTIPPLPTNILP